MSKYLMFYKLLKASRNPGIPVRKVGLLGFLLACSMAVASAQSGTRPVLPAAPSATATPVLPDSAHLTTQLTRGGVRFVVHERGKGALPQAGSRVAVRYAGFLPDGRLFDATAASGGPLRFRVGRGEVIRGWDELLPLLPAGSRARAWIPAALAYGATGVRDPDDDSRYLIPPNTELVFELQIVSVR